MRGCVLFLGILLAGCAGAPVAAPVEGTLCVWFDATANWERLSTPEKCAAVLSKCRAVGVTEIVVDVKPISGEVLYPSAIAPRLTEWKGLRSEFDRLDCLVREGHAMGMRVLASLNLFSEAHKKLKRGPLYRHLEWQTVLWRPEGRVRTLEVDRSAHDYAGFTNPIRADVQAYELSILEEIVRRYPVDGIVLDRMRYNDLESDFSDESLAAFGARAPEEIYAYEGGARKPGPRYREWLGWRAANLRTFADKARERIRKARASCECDVYVGAWYPVYEGVGAHWASAGHEGWAPRGTGFAELMDRIYVGCYYFEVEEGEVRGETTLEDGRTVPKESWYSVEGSAKMAREVARRPIIGSLFVQQYKDHPEQFRRAVEMCRRQTGGVMIFDLVYLEEYGWWDTLRK